ncbi:MAG: hypothetical protein WBW76_16375 [Candidatus Cybelea sp.]
MIEARERAHQPPNWAAIAGAYAVISCAAAAALARSGPESFLRMHAVWLLLWATTTAVALACSGQWYVHRRFNHLDFVRQNEVGGFIVSIVGALYSVLLGFMTVIAWQHFSDSRQLVAQESAASTDAWHTSVGLPAEERSRVRRDMLLYANAMLQSEWPAMRSRGFDKDADVIVMDAIGAAGDFNPRNLKEANAQSATLQQLGALHDYRQRRLSGNRSGMASFEWLVLMIGATCIVGFCWLFGLENENVHLMMTSAVTIIMTTTLVLLFELQCPFQSDLRIAPDDWNGVVSHIEFMQSGAQGEMRM